MKIADGFSGQRFIATPFTLTEQLKKNPLTKSLYIQAIGHFPKAYFHYVNRDKGCNEYVYIYCTEGSGWVYIEDKHFRLTANHFIVIPKGKAHKYFCDENAPWSIYWIHLCGELAEILTRDFNEPVSIAYAENSRIDERNLLFDEIYNVIDSNPSIQAHEYACGLLHHYLESLRNINIYRLSRPIRHSPSPCDTIVRKATHYMNENIENRLTMDELAEICGYSKSYLYRKFIKETGQAPIDYFLRLKINRACFLLIHTNMSINQISLKLAYSESQYMARSFKRIMGISASEYRNRNFSGINS